MTAIYTKTGDRGQTGLFGGGRVDKDDPRVDAYGEVDELNAAIGFARSQKLPSNLDRLALSIQEQLFTVGAVLATPAGTKAQGMIPKVQDEWVETMEESMDEFDRQLPALTHFILPGGSAGASALHLARTICRRAERKIVALHRGGKVGTEVLIYLNRLSDLLFMMARVSNFTEGVKDVLWLPPKP